MMRPTDGRDKRTRLQSKRRIRRDNRQPLALNAILTATTERRIEPAEKAHHDVCDAQIPQVGLKEVGHLW